MFKVKDDDKAKVGALTHAVVSIFLDASEDTENAFLKEWNLAEPDREEFKLNLDLIEDEFKEEGLDEYYYYDGGLTTPTCDEIVNYHVMKKPLKMSKA
jgi:carbonic anhydrase